MIRGGHIDVTVLGGLQVSERGDLANWSVPGRGGGAIGGAMDLAAGARRVIVAMEHTTRQGQPRIVSECSYPLTAEKCVNLIVTNLAVIEVTEGGLVLKETAPDVSVAEVQAATDASLQVSAQMRVMDL
jgi:3-oxoacid CoA-transferase B subunit